MNFGFYFDRVFSGNETGGEPLACFERAKKGFLKLIWEDHAKSVDATYHLVVQTTRGDELIAE